MKEKIKAIPMIIIDVLVGLLNALKTTFSTTKGAVSLLVVSIVIADVWKKGDVGVIGYVITLAKDILTTVSNIAVRSGWQIALVIMVFMLLIDKKRS